MRHFIFRRITSSISSNELNLIFSIFKRHLVVHVVFAVRSALKHSVFCGLLGPKFWANFFNKIDLLSVDVMLGGGLKIMPI